MDPIVQQITPWAIMLINAVVMRVTTRLPFLKSLPTAVHTFPLAALQGWFTSSHLDQTALAAGVQSAISAVMAYGIHVSDWLDPHNLDETGSQSVVATKAATKAADDAAKPTPSPSPIKVALMLLGAGGLLGLAGCANLTTASTQPTSVGVTSADFLAKTYTTAANLETQLVANGTIKGSALTTLKQADNAASAAVQQAGLDAQNGSSGLQADLNAAQAALAAFEDGLNSTSK